MLKARLATAQAALDDEIRRSRALNRIAAALGAGGDVASVAEAVLDGALELTDATFGAVFCDIDADDRLYAVAGAPRPAAGDSPPPWLRALFDAAVHGQGVTRCDDIAADPRHGAQTPFPAPPPGRRPTVSYLAAPIVTRAGEVLGGLVFGHPEPGRFTERSESLLGGLAAQAAVAIDSVRARAAALRELDERRRAEERLKFALDSGRLGSWELDVETRAYEASDICKANYGRGPDETFGFADLVATVHPGDRQRMTAAIEVAIRDGVQYDIEYRVVTPVGETRWVHARGRAAQTADDGGVRRMAGVSLDITGRKHAEARQRLLLNELNHRVKNTLATVQSIAVQTLRTAPSPTAFREAFEARLSALSQTHNLLTEQNWEGASLREVFDAELEAFGGRHRVALDYARDVRLSPKAIVTLGMAVHELATNAVKYGALSDHQGEVTVTWRIERDDDEARLRLTWTERNGPPVVPPTRRGFGARLLEKGLAGELSGDVRLTYDAAGVVCDMTLPMRALEPR